MKASTLMAFVGFFVILLLVASAGIFHGQMCVSSIGCVGADGGGLTIKAPKAGP